MLVPVCVLVESVFPSAKLASLTVKMATSRIFFEAFFFFNKGADLVKQILFTFPPEVLFPADVTH